jgi:hypothetical protein
MNILYNMLYQLVPNIELWLHLQVKWTIVYICYPLGNGILLVNMNGII